MIFDKLVEIMMDNLSVQPQDVTLDTSFKDDLAVDSLDLYDLVMALSEEFNIEVKSIMYFLCPSSYCLYNPPVSSSIVAKPTNPLSSRDRTARSIVYSNSSDVISIYVFTSREE